MAHRIDLRARAKQLFVYSGRSLLVTDRDGMVSGAEIEGLYVDHTRLLSRYQLAIDGRPFQEIMASSVGADGLLAYAEVAAGPGIPAGSVYAEIAHLLGDGLRTVICFQNYHQHDDATFEVSVTLAADFADLYEAEHGNRQQCAPVETVWDASCHEVRFRYCEPRLDRAVAVRFEAAPTTARFQDGVVVIPLALPPRSATEVQVSIEPIFDGERRREPRRAFGEPTTPLAQLRERLSREATRLTTTNAAVARAWRTAVDDLASLALGIEEGPAAPAAGLPIYQYLFGRDTLTIGWQSLLATPELLRDSLRANAAWQGSVVDDWRDEEPGKLLHQLRWGPLSLLGHNPHDRYYGDFATPPDFLIGLGQYLAWTNDRATVQALLPAARKVIDWLERYGDADGDGFLEYDTRSAKGVKNQGWKDSDDAIVDERGEIVPNPIAPCEIQSYWYVGLEQVSAAFFALGDRAYALELWRKSRDLKRRFDQAYWMDDAGFYALALGPDKRQVRSIASNAGHLLATGIVPVARARGVVERLMEPDVFSGWGIRTLSSEHPAYNPFSYHLGSVWPVENGTFAFGFARYGHWEELHRLAAGLFDLSDLFVSNRLPEAIGGLPRDATHPHPGLYFRSCEPQGWSASMLMLLIQALLGLRPVAPLGLLLIDPHLPPWLPDLRLEGVRVGQARLDLEFRRSATGETTWRVTRRTGRIRVLRQPVPQGPAASPTGRARAALSSLVRA